MTSQQRVLTALTGGVPDHVPWCELLVDPTIGQRMKGGEESDWTQQRLADLIGLDGFNCWGFTAPYFAQQEIGADGRIWVTHGLLKSRHDLRDMKFPDVHDNSRYDQANQWLSCRHGRAIGAASTFTVDCVINSMGYEDFAVALHDDLAFVKEVTRRFADWHIESFQRLCTMDFDYLWCFDDIAFNHGPLIAPEMFRNEFLPIMKEVAAAITKPWIFHSDGNLFSILDDLLTLGMSGLHPIDPTGMDIRTTKALYGDRVCLVGNIDVALLTTGTPEEVYSSACQTIRDIMPGGRYIVSSSNTLPSYASAENVQALAQAVKDCGSYSNQPGTAVYQGK
jgi:uroporphyrinogen decarboxylase